MKWESGVGSIIQLLEVKMLNGKKKFKVFSKKFKFFDF